MCLILFALDAHPDYQLVMVGNRDEFYNRPTQRAHFWEDHPHVLAGKDLLAGGTWMGISKYGKLAGVTNYREVPLSIEKPRSRGELPIGFLLSEERPVEFVKNKLQLAEEFAPFNMLAGTAKELLYTSNKTGALETLTEGVHGLSNHLLNTPWPKLLKGKELLSDWLSDPNPQATELLDAMMDEGRADDELLPNTGIGEEMEKALSPLFIRLQDYGTCLTTLLLVSRKGEVTFIERSHYPQEAEKRDALYRWKF